MLEVVRRVMNELPYHPKEVAYLVSAMLAKPDRELESCRDELESFRAILETERANGTEAIH